MADSTPAAPGSLLDRAAELRRARRKLARQIRDAGIGPLVEHPVNEELRQVRAELVVAASAIHAAGCPFPELEAVTGLSGRELAVIGIRDAGQVARDTLRLPASAGAVTSIGLG